MRSIAFVTTCKGRLHHLMQTLPRFVACAPDEIVVVDYGCPDESGNWVEENFPGVRVVRVNDDPYFCLARARNEGAAVVDSEWLCFVDADMLVDPGWGGWMRESLQNGCFYRVEEVEGERDRNAWGTCICPRSAFLTVGGYDEVIRGWGGEDDELYFRLRSAGLVEDVFPEKYSRGIPHSDEERTAFHENRDRFLQQDINRCYMEIKRSLADYLGGVDTNLCHQIFEALSHEVPEKRGNGSGRWRACISLETPQGKMDFEVGRGRRFVFFGPRKFFVVNKRTA
jgi:glycosyltransferase involved in cell wall biosynthesis